MRRAIILISAVSLVLIGSLGAHRSRHPARAAAAAAAASTPDTAFVHVQGESASTGAFVAYPASRKPAPVVLVAFEWWGLNDQIRSIADRIAGQGYVAVVPDLYHGRVASDPEQAHVLSRGLEYPASNRDMDAALAWLRKNPR